MTAGPQTKPLELGQCQKCNAYVFAAQVDGVDTAVDPVPVTGAEKARDALLAGRALYRAEIRSGKPYRLHYVLPAALALALKINEPLYTTHPCMATGTVRTARVEVAPEGPQQAPVTPGGPRGGVRHAPAPVSGSQGRTAKIAPTAVCSAPFPSPAKPASRRRSRPTRCILCKKVIQGGEPNIVAIEYDGRIVWAYHVDD